MSEMSTPEELTNLDAAPSSGTSRWPYRIAFAASALLLVYVLIVNAWAVDDAYITLRTVDNFVNGLGLTWNPAERVQVYTHPLWMFFLAAAYWVTSETYFTVMVLSFLISVLAVIVAYKSMTRDRVAEWWHPPLLVLALIASKAVIDYASSGLENPLSYLLVALFWARFQSLRLVEREVTEKDVRDIFLIAGLSMFNRSDTILLYMPALLHLIWLARSRSKARLLQNVAIGLSPIIAWTLFSLFYYGSPFPNTAYAKAASTGFPSAWILQRGFEYLANSISWDTLSYLMTGAALWMAIRRRLSASILALIGVGLYIVYTVVSAAAATHMSGRFFAVPFFIVIIMLVKSIHDRRTALIISAVAAAYILLSPLSAIKFGTSAYHLQKQPIGCFDIKWYVLQEGDALLNWRPGKSMPDHPWYHYGEQVRDKGASVHVGGALGRDGIGYFGFAAGPSIHIIDRVALSDPLLARLPAIKPADISQWTSGHFHRLVPDGYVESITRDRNLLTDPRLREYYDVVRLITRGPLWSSARLAAIVKLNLGMYDHLIKPT